MQRRIDFQHIDGIAGKIAHRRHVELEQPRGDASTDRPLHVIVLIMAVHEVGRRRVDDLARKVADTDLQQSGLVGAIADFEHFVELGLFVSRQRPVRR